MAKVTQGAVYAVEAAVDGVVECVGRICQTIGLLIQLGNDSLLVYSSADICLSGTAATTTAVIAAITEDTAASKTVAAKYQAQGGKTNNVIAPAVTPAIAISAAGVVLPHHVAQGKFAGRVAHNKISFHVQKCEMLFIHKTVRALLPFAR